MAKIKNTFVPNSFGDGYEQEVTLDNGEQYIVRNTFVPNSFGDGYEKEIIKKGEKTTVDEPLSFTIFKCILAIFGLFIIFGLVKLNIILIIIGVFGFLATIVIFCSNNLKAAIKILLLLLGVSIPVIIGVIILCAISIPHCVLENLF